MFITNSLKLLSFFCIFIMFAYAIPDKNSVIQQYLEGWSDKKLCEVLDITPRTLYNYQKDATVMTLGQVQAVLDKLDIPLTNLLHT